MTVLLLKRIARGKILTILLRSDLALCGIKTYAKVIFYVFPGWSLCNPSVVCTMEGNLLKIVVLLDYLG